MPHAVSYPSATGCYSSTKKPGLLQGWPFQYQRTQAQCPRNWNQCRVVADLVIASLIFQRPAERDRVLATERSLSLRCAFQYDFLQKGEWLLVNRNTFVERFERVDL